MSSNSDMNNQTGQATLELAKRIREHQGVNESEVSFGGEADLHQHYNSCQKNPGHNQFIPIQKFKTADLPAGYHDNVWADWVRAEADMTCRLSVRYTSMDRPSVYPGRQQLYPFYQDRGEDFLRTGTGWVTNVQKYTEKSEKSCECEDCRDTNNAGKQLPKKSWGKVTIQTACHVVFDSEEAKNTTCELFYDTNETHISLCPVIKGLRVVESNIQGDTCLMSCVTHDMDLVEKLHEMDQHRVKLYKEILKKYRFNRSNNGQSSPDPSSGHNIIISHPHGCSKQLTIGVWTHKQTYGDAKIFTHKVYDWEADCVDTSYRYRTATCPGSSGAPVFRLPDCDKGWWYVWCCHPHSEGSEGNDNKSAVKSEYVSPPSPKNGHGPNVTEGGSAQ